MNPSKFKDKILSKLLNKKATALLKLKDLKMHMHALRTLLKWMQMTMPFSVWVAVNMN